MKAPLDEKELQEMCKATAFAYGKLRSDRRNVHTWYAVSSQEKQEGFVAEFDEKGDCVYTLEFHDLDRLSQYAAMLFTSSLAVE